jgi:hypothetical protein
VFGQDAGGSLMPMANQVRRAVACIYKNAKSFGGDSIRLYELGTLAKNLTARSFSSPG